MSEITELRAYVMISAAMPSVVIRALRVTSIAARDTRMKKTKISTLNVFWTMAAYVRGTSHALRDFHMIHGMTQAVKNPTTLMPIKMPMRGRS